MEPKTLTPRFTVGTVSTNDKEKAIYMLKVYAASKMRHEDIYLKGIEAIEKELNIKSDIDIIENS